MENLPADARLNWALALLVLFLLFIIVLAGTAKARKGGPSRSSHPLGEARRVLRALLYLCTAILVLLSALIVMGICAVVLSAVFYDDETPLLEPGLGGVVLDPQGALVPDARVVIRYTCDSCELDHERLLETFSDTEGAYLFEPCYAHGPGLLVGFSQGLASEPVEFDLSPDPQTDPEEQHASAPMNVHLVPEGRITGTLVDGGGHPLAGREVKIITSAHMEQVAETDEHGRYEVVGLPPGQARMIVSLTDEESAAFGEDSSWSDCQAIRRELSLSVVSGQTIEALIPPRPVRLRARMIQGTSQMSGAIEVTSKAGETISLNVTRENHGDSAFVRPGAYRLKTRVGRSQLPWEVDVEIPDVLTFDYELRIPIGSIEGFVRGPAGEPTADAEVWWIPDDGEAYDPNWKLGTADENGRFSFELPARDARVSARAGPLQTPWTPVEVRADATQEIELVLTAR